VHGILVAHELVIRRIDLILRFEFNLNAAFSQFNERATDAEWRSLATRRT